MLEASDCAYSKGAGEHLGVAAVGNHKEGWGWKGPLVHHTRSLRSLLAYQGAAGSKREWPSTGLSILTEYSSQKKKYTTIHENIRRNVCSILDNWKFNYRSVLRPSTHRYLPSTLPLFSLLVDWKWHSWRVMRLRKSKLSSFWRPEKAIFAVSSTSGNWIHFNNCSTF